METAISGNLNAGVHASSGSAELKSQVARLVLCCVQEPIGSYPMNSSRPSRSISQCMARKTVKQCVTADLYYTVADLHREFPNDDACLEYIKEQRWPNGVTKCEKCNIERKHSRVSGRTAYACDHCGNHIYPLQGTVFARSATSLKTWFYVMYLLTSAGCGITAKRIQRETGVTYKTAWRILRHLQQLSPNEELQSACPMIEIDNPGVLRIPQNHGAGAAPEPESEFIAVKFA